MYMYVFCSMRNKLLVSCTYEALNPPNMTFQEFLCRKLDQDGHTFSGGGGGEPPELDKTFAGSSKQKLD